jgi:hypothetical protein
LFALRQSQTAQGQTLSRLQKLRLEACSSLTVNLKFGGEDFTQELGTPLFRRLLAGAPWDASLAFTPPNCETNPILFKTYCPPNTNNENFSLLTKSKSYHYKRREGAALSVQCKMKNKKLKMPDKSILRLLKPGKG